MNLEMPSVYQITFCFDNSLLCVGGVELIIKILGSGVFIKMSPHVVKLNTTGLDKVDVICRLGEK